VFLQNHPSRRKYVCQIQLCLSPLGQVAWRGARSPNEAVTKLGCGRAAQMVGASINQLIIENSTDGWAQSEDLKVHGKLIQVGCWWPNKEKAWICICTLVPS
jgi:hypothetical protein